MVKIFNYLYYKLYRATLLGSLNDIAEYAAMVYFIGLFTINLLVIGALLRKLEVIPTFTYVKEEVAVFTIFLFVFGYLYFLRKKRYKEIIKRYEGENEVSRKRGNLLVWAYVIISFLAIFIVACYRPGFL
jgi:hypothetical protein